MQITLNSLLDSEVIERAICWFSRQKRISPTYALGEDGFYTIEFDSSVTEMEIAQFRQLIFDFNLRSQIDHETKSLRKTLVRSALKACYDIAPK